MFSLIHIKNHLFSDESVKDELLEEDEEDDEYKSNFNNKNNENNLIKPGNEYIKLNKKTNKLCASNSQ